MVDEFSMTLTKRYLKKYQKASKKERGKILKEYVSLTGVSCDCAKQRFHRSLKVFPKRSGTRVGRPSVYGPMHRVLLRQCWDLSGRICGERLHPMIGIYLKELSLNQELKSYSPQAILEVSRMSLVTVKRVVGSFPKSGGKRRGKRNLGILKQIPVEADFGKNTISPGFVEVDYVEHSGGNSSGLFGLSGCYVDLYSQWVARAAGMGKSLTSVKSIHQKATERIYHPVLKYHPDNAPTILQHLFELMTKGKKPPFSLSRSRPYKKNDNAHVEQKNGDKIRDLVGYYRFDTHKER